MNFKKKSTQSNYHWFYFHVINRIIHVSDKIDRTFMNMATVSLTVFKCKTIH